MVLAGVLTGVTLPGQEKKKKKRRGHGPGALKDLDGSCCGGFLPQAYTSIRAIASASRDRQGHIKETRKTGAPMRRRPAWLIAEEVSSDSADLPLPGASSSCFGSLRPEKLNPQGDDHELQVPVLAHASRWKLMRRGHIDAGKDFMVLGQECCSGSPRYSAEGGGLQEVQGKIHGYRQCPQELQETISRPRHRYGRDRAQGGRFPRSSMRGSPGGRA